jgi:hypothetical protein
MAQHAARRIAQDVAAVELGIVFRLHTKFAEGLELPGKSRERPYQSRDTRRPSGARDLVTSRLKKAVF